MALAFIHGPICRLFYRFSEQKWLPLSFGQYTDYIQKCQNRFAGSLALFTLAVIVASLVQIRNTSGPAQATLYAYKISGVLIKNLKWTMLMTLVPTLDFSKFSRTRFLCWLVLLVLMVTQHFVYPGFGTPEAVTPLLDLCQDSYYGPRPQMPIIIPSPFDLGLWKRLLVALIVTLPLVVGFILLQTRYVPIMTWILDFSPVLLFFQWFVTLWSFGYERPHM